MPARDLKTVRLSLYAIHAHGQASVYNYQQFFEEISRIEPEALLAEVEDSLEFTLEGTQLRGSMYTGRVVALTPGERVTYFNHDTQKTEEVSPPKGRAVARVARFAVALGGTERRLVLESRRNGITADRLEKYFTRLSRKLGSPGAATFSLPAVLTEDIIEKIDELTRIRVAGVAFTRPNIDWDDQADQASQIAAESGAQRVETTAYAPRGESLDFEGGIIGFIKQGAKRPNPNMVSFRVIGDSPNSADEVKLTDKSFPARTSFEVSSTQLETETDTQFEREARAFATKAE